jgi:hypothetical protein
MHRRPPSQPRPAHDCRRPPPLLPRTRAYLDRRLAEGRTKREAMRCLKRYIARRSTEPLADLTTLRTT